ncbi:MAG: FHA domain-containing protein [Bacteriovoracaceae bacterium]
MDKGVLVLKDLDLPKKTGSYFRLIALNGKNKGDSYFITGNRAVVGRGDKVEIQIQDTKASREHAEFVKSGGNLVVTDLKSQNGVMVNDLKISQHVLKENDRVLIGQTVLKFNKVDIKEELDTKQNTKPVKFDFNSEPTLPEEAENLKGKNKKQLIIIAVAVLAILYVFLGGDTEQQKSTKKRDNGVDKFKDISDNFAGSFQKKKLEEEKELKKKLGVIINRGLRELREGNYYRAIGEFNLVLILNPNDSRASFYLNKTKQALDEEISQNFINAKRNIEALQYKNSFVHYCANIRLLANYPDDQRYKDSIANIQDVEKILGLTPGEIKCL